MKTMNRCVRSFIMQDYNHAAIITMIALSL